MARFIKLGHKVESYINLESIESIAVKPFTLDKVKTYIVVFYRNGWQDDDHMGIYESAEFATEKEAIQWLKKILKD